MNKIEYTNGKILKDNLTLIPLHTTLIHKTYGPAKIQGYDFTHDNNFYICYLSDFKCFMHCSPNDLT
jgi:hypothetical protein